MLWQRIVTAAILLALLLPAIFLLPAWTWALASLGFLVAGACEWGNLLASASPERAKHHPAMKMILVTAVAGLILLGWRLALGWPQVFVLAVCLLATVWWCVAAPLRLRRHRSRAGGVPLAAFLLLACWIALIELHAISPLVLLSAMSIVWIADSVAYFVGRALGRRKLAPTISPGKSWEGAIGGAIGVVAVAAWVGATAVSPGWMQTLPAELARLVPLAVFVGIFIGLAALSVLGDLHESLLKREAGVKDSGWLLPGHGGVLDRIDALIPVMPAVVSLHTLAGMIDR
jgi:phosphatidate cytidylyltransferase